MCYHLKTEVRVSGSCFKWLFPFPKRMDEKLPWKCVIDSWLGLGLGVRVLSGFSYSLKGWMTIQHGNVIISRLGLGMAILS